MTQDTEDVVALDMTPTGAFKLPRWQYQLRAAAACLEADPPLTREFRKSVSDMLGRHQTAIQSLSDRIDALEAEKASIPEGAAFFKALKHGATFKWMELVQAGTSQARLDAQSDLQILLAAVAKKVEEIEAIDRAALHQEGIAP